MKGEILLDKFKGAMLSAALGDALGASHMRVGKILSYTDDTAMMIALAETLIDDKGILDPLHLAWKFVDRYEREPWRGYGPGPPKIFRMIRKGSGPFGLDRQFYPGGSYGNGGAMRITPIGLFYYDKPGLLKWAVNRSCRPTHSHPLAIEGALLQASSIAFAVKLDGSKPVEPENFVDLLEGVTDSEIYRRKLETIPKLLERDAKRLEIIRELGNGVEAFNSVPTAIYCYLRHQDPLKSIEFAVSLGGDTDTIACMAGAIAGAHKGLSTCPVELLKKLEDAWLIEELAEKLYELKAGKPSP